MLPKWFYTMVRGLKQTWTFGLSLPGVPTHSNMGDDPSRGRFEMLEMFGARRTEVTDSLVSSLTADVAFSRAWEWLDGANWLGSRISPKLDEKKLVLRDPEFPVFWCLVSFAVMFPMFIWHVRILHVWLIFVLDNLRFEHARRLFHCATHVWFWRGWFGKIDKRSSSTATAIGQVAKPHGDLRLQVWSLWIPAVCTVTVVHKLRPHYLQWRQRSWQRQV